MIFKLVDKISEVSAWVSKLAIVVLVLSMLYEVIARYVFNSSTIWAFDISYMATGVAFVLGVAWTAQIDGHIKVDVLSSLLPNNVYRSWPQKLSATPKNFSKVLDLCPIQNSASKNVPPYR